MVSVTFTIDDELKEKLKRFSWVNWSKLVAQEAIKRQQLEKLRSKLGSKEEQEFIDWSVKLGRKAKKETLRKLFLELSPSEREELLTLKKSPIFRGG